MRTQLQKLDFVYSVWNYRTQLMARQPKRRRGAEMVLLVCANLHKCSLIFKEAQFIISPRYAAVT